MVIDVFCHHSSKGIEEMIAKAVRRQEAEGPKRTWTPQSAFPFPLESARGETRLALLTSERSALWMPRTLPALLIGAIRNT